MLLAVMIQLLDITNIHLAAILCVLQSNNISLRGAVYNIFKQDVHRGASHCPDSYSFGRPLKTLKYTEPPVGCLNLGMVLMF